MCKGWRESGFFEERAIYKSHSKGCVKIPSVENAKKSGFLGEGVSEMEQDTEQEVIIRARNQQEEERINLWEVKK